MAEKQYSTPLVEKIRFDERIPFERSHCGWVRRLVKGPVEVCHLIVDHADRHYHKHATQWYYVLSGVGMLKLYSDSSVMSSDLRKGGHYEIPAGIKHQPIEQSKLELLVVSSSLTEDDTYF